MIIDAKLAFSTAQDITTDTNSESYIDLAAARNIGAGEPMAAVIFVTTTFDTDEEDGTLDISVITDDETSFGSETIIASAPQLTEENLTAGRDPIVIPLPPLYTAERYLALDYNVGNHAFKAGKVDAYLMRMCDIQTNQV